mmetsp:Transcript_24818/g.17521  ORF Transcript_24818/g.17521 Transcript_24818/m.17521 type:complete len:80 (-) Transcript_24818:382-621(-)
MLFTFIVALMGAKNYDFGRFCRQPSVLISSLILLIVSMCVLGCSEKARRAVPTNYIWLALFTVCEGVFVSSTTASMQVR